jgi:5-methylcytosine-specific restriction endonuclease McrA
MKHARSPTGTCHLCGFVGKLTFEHVPPASAFNDRRISSPDIRAALALDDLDLLDSLPRRQSQRGQGGYTLCGHCNSTTGSWYVPEYSTGLGKPRLSQLE